MCEFWEKPQCVRIVRYPDPLGKCKKYEPGLFVGFHHKAGRGEPVTCHEWLARAVRMAKPPTLRRFLLLVANNTGRLLGLGVLSRPQYFRISIFLQPFHRPCGKPVENLKVEFRKSLVLPFINTVTFADGACEARSRSEEEAMQGHRRRRETKRSPATPIRPKGWGRDGPISLLLLLADVPASPRRRASIWAPSRSQQTLPYL